jgi:hypothetical protein
MGRPSAFFRRMRSRALPNLIAPLGVALPQRIRHTGRLVARLERSPRRGRPGTTLRARHSYKVRQHAVRGCVQARILFRNRETGKNVGFEIDIG